MKKCASQHQLLISKYRDGLKGIQLGKGGRNEKAGQSYPVLILFGIRAKRGRERKNTIWLSNFYYIRGPRIIKYSFCSLGRRLSVFLTWSTLKANTFCVCNTFHNLFSLSSSWMPMKYILAYCTVHYNTLIYDKEMFSFWRIMIENKCYTNNVSSVPTDLS